MNGAVIVSAVRTPIGAYCGMLREMPVEKLAAVVLDEAVGRAHVEPTAVDDVILGHSFANGESPNVARLALLEAGWPVHIPGLTIDRRCCSGLESVCIAASQVQLGNAEIVVAGGCESMSRAELYIPGEYIKWGLGGRQDPKWGFFPKHHGSMDLWGLPFYDRIQRGRPMHQPISRFGEMGSMMVWAETAAKEEGLSREEVDAWAVRSHARAIEATDAGKFSQEILPIETKVGRESVTASTDETPRRDVSIEKLAKLKPMYPDGVCTAGNSSSENDGAAALVVMSHKRAEALGLPPMARLKAYAVAATDPTLTYRAVADAVEKVLTKAELRLEAIDLIEIQEAFAAQTLADAKLMGLSNSDRDRKVNVNGSGISLGHPIGATGAMRLTTLLHEMVRQGARLGLLTICGGGGLGIAAILERP
ncbi:MAG: acetyl-CoA acetyltransferase [Deltaproteobacteria bacterium RIFOXYB12_FULL_58_9]|nr:MAG: acetyl-CoA acetyltransferase [Deltaproteobacteria bacterium RIFOXYB12_FULL_58_9]